MEGDLMAKKWTQEEAIAFECAREVISELMAIKTAQLAAISRGVPVPDVLDPFLDTFKRSPGHEDEQVSKLRAERSRLARERASLRVGDAATIARVRLEYGEAVRAWRASPGSFAQLSALGGGVTEGVAHVAKS